MNRVRELLKLIVHGRYDTSTAEGRSLERTRGIALTALTAMLAKVFAMAVPLVTVRVTLSYMGEEIYGLWSAVTSFFAMFTFADLGLGSGLQTELSKATATDNEKLCRQLVSSCYTVLTIVAISLMIIFICIYPFIDWAGLVNATTGKTIAMAGCVVIAIVTSRVINIPMALIQRTQFAMQEGYRSNLWNCAGNILSLIFVFVIYYLDLGALTMIWASSMITVIVATFNMIIYFKWQKPALRPQLRFFDKIISKKLLKTGVLFFILSIFTSLSLSIDNFIVAHACSLAEVTPYSVMYKIVSMIGVVSAMLSTPMWSANGEALERGESKWVSKATSRVAGISFLFATVCSIGVLLLIKPALWILTDGIVQANYFVLLGMCVLQIVISFTAPYFMVLNGAGIIKFQIVNYIVYAVISLPLKYILGIRFGAMAITWCGAITYIILLTMPTIYRSLRYLYKANELSSTD